MLPLLRLAMQAKRVEVNPGRCEVLWLRSMAPPTAFETSIRGRGIRLVYFTDIDPVRFAGLVTIVKTAAALSEKASAVVRPVGG